MPKFTGTEGVLAEEHLESFYSYADNLDISEDDVWMRVFVQSLDGEAKKWFKELTPRTMVEIEALDDAFLKHWGDKKDLLYYHTEFGDLKRENGELMSDFNKKFNCMYSKIPAEDAALEVESNIMVAEKLKGNVDRRRQSDKSSLSSDPKIDKMTKMIESLASEISKLKVEQHPGKGRVPNTFAPPNPNSYKRAIIEEEQFEEDDVIHCFEDKGSAPFLTFVAYEKSLFSDQISQEWNGEAVIQAEDQQRYNLRLKMNTAKETPVQRVVVPTIRFQSEIQKLRIPMPLIELVKNESFKISILEALEFKAIQTSTDYVNLRDDEPVVILSPMIENCENNSPSFYVSLTIHDKILQNYLLDTGASHNLMPKAVMDKLGLDITKPYHDLFSFDSRKVKCLGLIKDLAITLPQLPMKSMMMDIVVADVPPKFGMLLSKGCIKRLGGMLPNDLSYAIVPIFGG
eukprot:PITA_36066